LDYFTPHFLILSDEKILQIALEVPGLILALNSEDGHENQDFPQNLDPWIDVSGTASFRRANNRRPNAASPGV
jgi:hypothetical protein